MNALQFDNACRGYDALAGYIARRYHNTGHPFLAVEDLKQNAYVVIVDALRRYEQKPEEDQNRLVRTAVFRGVRRIVFRAYGERPHFVVDSGKLFESIPDVNYEHVFAEIYCEQLLDIMTQLLSEGHMKILEELLWPNGTAWREGGTQALPEDVAFARLMSRFGVSRSTLSRRLEEIRAVARFVIKPTTPSIYTRHALDMMSKRDGAAV